jgi:hypothetical protein
LDLRLAEFGAWQRVVELHQQLTTPHARAILKSDCTTRPATSGCSVTLWRERKLPTAWASS